MKILLVNSMDSTIVQVDLVHDTDPADPPNRHGRHGNMLGPLTVSYMFRMDKHWITFLPSFSMLSIAP